MRQHERLETDDDRAGSGKALHHPSSPLSLYRARVRFIPARKLPFARGSICSGEPGISVASARYCSLVVRGGDGSARRPSTEAITDRRRPLELHGLGRHRHGLDDGGRRARARCGSSDAQAAADRRRLIFVQISDSHIGFNKDANTDVPGTLKAAIARINALPRRAVASCCTPATSRHLSKPEEFDSAEQLMRRSAAADVLRPGRARHAASTTARPTSSASARARPGAGWYSFDQDGVHFVGLVNVVDLKAGGLGQARRRAARMARGRPRRPLGRARRSSSSPTSRSGRVYPEWGWGTDDAAQALAYLKRFGSVTVLNGHIHQVMQKVEGNVTFHTAMSTAFPQPQPGRRAVARADEGAGRAGCGRSAGHHRHRLQRASRGTLAIVDQPLAQS